jgi:DNA-binding NarL/FixJ family response regulator
VSTAACNADHIFPTLSILDRKIKVIAKILLANYNKLARDAIKLLLSDRTDLEICAEAADGEEAVEKAKIECPDVAILDIAMPRMNGIQAAREILRFSPITLVLTDSLCDVQVLIIELKELGVKGFISKACMATDLIPAIEIVLGGGTCFRTEAAQMA